jgi:uncharacterized protein YjdB
MIEGRALISGVALDATWSSDNTGIATFSGGYIYGHSQGSTIVRITQPDNTIKTVYVSTYFSYPQPKTSIVQPSGDGVEITKWGGVDDGHYLGETLNEGDRLTILWRTVLADGSGLIMQYIRTPDGDEGYIRSNFHSDRPFRGNMAGYFTDMTVGDTIYKYPMISEEPADTAQSYSAENENIISVSKVNRPSGDNQGEITGRREGTSSMTAVIDYNGQNLRTTAEISVYSPINNVSGIIKNNNVIVRRGANASYNPDRILNANAGITISGESGSFYRIGTSEYVPKSDVTIPATGISLDRSSITLYNQGDADTLVLADNVRPQYQGNTLATGTVTWSSSDPSVATVNSGGRVTGISGGRAVISATIDGRVARCNVAVAIPAKSASIVKVQNIAINKSHKINHSVVSSSASSKIYGNSISWTIASSTKSTIGKTTGRVKTRGSEGAGYANLYYTAPKPTVGTRAKEVKAKTFVSVYTPKSFNVVTLRATLKNQGAVTATTKSYPELYTTAKYAKNTVLKVIGSCGAYYYVRNTNNLNDLKFVKKSDVAGITIIHKKLVPGQIFVPKDNKTAVLKETSKITVTTKRKGTAVTINTKKQKKKKLNTGYVTVKNAGFTNLEVTRKTGAKSSTKYYRIHITVPKPTYPLTAYTSKTANIYHCGSKECLLFTLKSGYRVTIIAFQGNMARVQFGYGGKTITRWIDKSDLAYISLGNPIVLSTKKGASTTRSVAYNYVPTQDRSVYSASLAVNNNLVSVTKATNSVKITGKQKDGFTRVRVNAGKDGRFSALVPVSVYEPMDYPGYTNARVYLRQGASDSCFAYSKLDKHQKVRILGESAGYYYVRIGTKYGFVKKKYVVHMEVSNVRQTVDLNTSKYPTVKVTIFNGSEIKWSNTNNVVTIKRIKRKKYKYKNGTSKLICTYRVIPRKEATVNAKVTSKLLSARYFVSVYNKRAYLDEGFTNANITKHRIASNNSKYKQTHPTNGQYPALNKVKILGKCGADWMYVEHIATDKKAWVREQDISYIVNDVYTKDIYRYHKVNVRTYIANNKANRTITGSLSDSKIASSKLLTGSTGDKSYQIEGLKPGTVYLTGRAYYSGNNYISQRTRINIKNIKIVLTKSTKDIFIKSNFDFNAKVETLPNANVTWKSSNPNILSINNKTGMLQPKSRGTATVSATYRSLKKSVKVNITNTVRNIKIYQTKKRRTLDEYGNATEDLVDNDKSRKQLLHENKNSITEAMLLEDSPHHESTLKDSARFFSTGDLEKDALSMVKHFMNGTGDTYKNKHLTSAAVDTYSTMEYVKEIRNNFDKIIKTYNGNVLQMAFTYGDESSLMFKNLQNTARLVFADTNGGLQFMVHDVWGNEISVKKYEINGNKYNATLSICLYDHFGLDSNDIKKFGSLSSGIASWYILQHYKKFNGNHKPFVTEMEFDIYINGTV